MADFQLKELFKTYEKFMNPQIIVRVNGNLLGDKNNLSVRRAEVELSSGYEAGIAELTLRGGYERDLKVFNIEKAKNDILLGSTIVISLGYGVSVREVFRGFIARVHFVAGGDYPAVVITAMDIKGSLMANRHSKRLKARYYCDAVKEVLDANALFAMKDDQGKDFFTLNLDNTPDKPGGSSEGGDMGGGGSAGGAGGEQKTDDVRVEMVEESDYEFIVKAAKKYNFEFFAVGNNLYFIEAKKNKEILIELSLGAGLSTIDVGYDISGLVRQVEVRSVDSDQGSFLGKTLKLNSNISMGSRAKPLVEKQSYVYIDPTVQSKEEAEYRANYLSTMMDYRLGSITATAVGLPELIPGRFIKINEMGKPVDNDFYLTRVRHIYTATDYSTEIEGCTNKIVK